MSSSISRTSEIANKEGASAVVSRVFVSTARAMKKLDNVLNHEQEMRTLGR
jgi:hypothetical protein